MKKNGLTFTAEQLARMKEAEEKEKAADEQRKRRIAKAIASEAKTLTLKLRSVKGLPAHFRLQIGTLLAPHVFAKRYRVLGMFAKSH